jgi:hypothetical protein
MQNIKTSLLFKSSDSFHFSNNGEFVLINALCESQPCSYQFCAEWGFRNCLEKTAATLASRKVPSTEDVPDVCWLNKQTTGLGLHLFQGRQWSAEQCEPPEIQNWGWQASPYELAEYLEDKSRCVHVAVQSLSALLLQLCDLFTLKWTQAVWVALFLHVIFGCFACVLKHRCIHSKWKQALEWEQGQGQSCPKRAGTRTFPSWVVPQQEYRALSCQFGGDDGTMECWA